MTLTLCASPCAARAAALDPFSMTERLDVGQNDPSPWSDDAPEDDDWEEFDPTPLEEWILDDFEWEIEEPWPLRGDFWDDSLDGEWNTAGRMTNDQMVHWCLVICHWSFRFRRTSMISESLVAEIRRLLAAGHTQREVARMVGVSRNTVSAIAIGERPSRAAAEETELSSLSRTVARRCATCGGMVFPPCRLCKLRALSA